MILAGRDLTIGYSDRTVGRGLDVSLARGEVLALLGPNGGGKTTLLKTLLGLLAPKEGEVHLGEKSLGQYAAQERARLIAYVPQSHTATFAFTVEAVVLMGRVSARGRSAPFSIANSLKSCITRRSRRSWMRTERPHSCRDRDNQKWPS